MSIIYLTFSLIFLVVGIQLLRGKWLKLAIRQVGTPAEQAKKNAEISSPGLIGLGLGLFCRGFFTDSVWWTTGRVIFLLGVAYLVIFVLIVFLKPNK
ncbi:hypothetical protein [Limosilactobacillus caccae]|jgi:hypothetical protein|uniref:hypothetical protein n=1 Tax=Limosilactobacillus caccae TaxID=1926284 RepID=UPI000970E424|nr:hypothetical protein [Limosilactobacillus caccae]